MGAGRLVARAVIGGPLLGHGTQKLSDWFSGPGQHESAANVEPRPNGQTRRASGVGRLVARTVIGGLFIGHGTQKLFGWFSGPGPQGTGQMMQSLQMLPPQRNALLAGATETASGALLAAGAATPLAASGLIGVMISAIRKVHLRNGVWVANGGYEYNLVLIAALLTLVDDGPGPLSVDSVRGREHHGLLWALGALALGAAASTAVIELGRRGAPPVAGAGAYPSEGDSAAMEATSGRPVPSES